MCLISVLCIILLIILSLKSTISLVLPLLSRWVFLLLRLFCSLLSHLFSQLISLFLVFRTLHTAQCQVVTVRVCRSQLVVYQAVRTLPGNQSLIITVCHCHIFVLF